MAGTAHLAELLRRHTASPRDALVHVDAGGHRHTTSWAALDADVDATAHGLRHDLDLHAGDRVAIAMSNTPAFITAYFATLRADLVAVPVNPGYLGREIARLLGEVDARVVLCDDATIGVVEEAVAGTHRVVVDQAGLDALTASGRGSGPRDPTRGGEDLAVLMFTAGTSGAPRGAMLSHRALLANLDSLQALSPSPVTQDDVVLLVLPLFHIYGLNAGLGLVAATGATGVLAEHFDPEATAALCRSERVTSLPGAPAIYTAWAHGNGDDVWSALRSVRVLASGSAPLPVAVLDQVQTHTGHPVYEGYGLTETAPVLSSTMASESVKPGSIGRPIPGVALRLVDETGGEVDQGDPGEIVARGANLFSGYWPGGADGPDAEGWWPTGDVAYADEDGDLFLVDRRRELVLVNGFNVYPREVEDALVQHPDVAEAAVIAIPDPATGEAVKAFVVPRAGASLRPEDVHSHVADRLARFKRPTVVEIVDELPHSAIGKVAKGRLRARESGR